MSLGDRIKRLRQERGWSQAQLGLRLGIHQKQISGYERGVHVPSTEVLIKLAELLHVSLDFLAFEDRDNTSRVSIADLDLLEKMKEIDRLSEKDKTTIKEILDTFILKNRFQQLASPSESAG